jgi:putative Ca2+/H+ antiporter (TMEM165/GDT1 family)
MDWKVAASAFVTVFLAELGDKTQLATFGIASAADSRRLAVFAGSAGALVLTSAIAVVAGAAVGKLVPAHWILRVSGLAFVALGAWSIWKSFRPEA